MKAKIKLPKKQNIQVLLKTLESISSIGKDGSLKFTNFTIENIEWSLISIINMGESISIHSKKQVLLKTFKKLAVESDYSEENFFKHLEDQLAEHFRQKEQTYFLLTTLSVGNLPFRRLSLGDGVLRIHGKDFPTKFRSHRRDLLNNYPQKKDNPDYCSISIEVQAKNPMDAYEKAFFHFEVFRSILCLHFNSRYEIRFDDFQLKPINKIRQGKWSTLHLEEGKSFHDKLHWYVQNYIEAPILYLDEKQKRNADTLVRKQIWRYNNCCKGHQKVIGKALLNFGRAFDERNRHAAFIKAWTVLEILTGTNQNDDLIKRCTALHSKENKPFQKQSLEALRVFRNEFVHEGDNGLDPLFACFQVQEAVYNLIMRFNLHYSGFFESIDDAVLFLDSHATEIKELEKRQRVIKRVLSRKHK